LQNGGTVVDWMMKDGAYQSSNVLTDGAAGWNVVGTGDFTGTGTDDVLSHNGCASSIGSWRTASTRAVTSSPRPPLGLMLLAQATTMAMARDRLVGCLTPQNVIADRSRRARLSEKVKATHRREFLHGRLLVLTVCRKPPPYRGSLCAYAAT
jgi:hypothetical protein